MCISSALCSGHLSCASKKKWDFFQISSQLSHKGSSRGVPCLYLLNNSELFLLGSSLRWLLFFFLNGYPIGQWTEPSGSHSFTAQRCSGWSLAPPRRRSLYSKSLGRETDKQTITIQYGKCYNNGLTTQQAEGQGKLSDPRHSHPKMSDE